MTTTKQSWFKRSLAVLLAVMMVMSMGITNVFAQTSALSVNVTDVGETEATLTITDNNSIDASVKYAIYRVQDSSIPAPSVEDLKQQSEENKSVTMTGNNVSAKISRLNADTEYTVYALIFSVGSDWKPVYTDMVSTKFETCSVAQDPLLINVTEITENEATLTITDNNSIDASVKYAIYRVQDSSIPAPSAEDLKQQSEENKSVTMTGNNVSAKISGLNADTEYTVYALIFSVGSDWKPVYTDMVSTKFETLETSEPIPESEVSLSYRQSSISTPTTIVFETIEEAINVMNGLDDQCVDVTLTLLEDIIHLNLTVVFCFNGFIHAVALNAESDTVHFSVLTGFDDFRRTAACLEIKKTFYGVGDLLSKSNRILLAAAL